MCYKVIQFLIVKSNQKLLHKYNHVSILWNLLLHVYSFNTWRIYLIYIS